MALESTGISGDINVYGTDLVCDSETRVRDEVGLQRVAAALYRGAA